MIVCGEAEGQKVRVALDFQDAQSVLGPRRFIVGDAFIHQLLELFQARDDWVIKTVIDEVRTPQNTIVPSTVQLFALLSKSYPRGLSAGVLFIEEDAFLEGEEGSLENVKPRDGFFDSLKRYLVLGLSPMGFVAACAEDTRLFTRFISRLLKRPDAFTEVSLLLPQEALLPSTNNG